MDCSYKVNLKLSISIYMSQIHCMGTDSEIGTKANEIQTVLLKQIHFPLYLFKCPLCSKDSYVTLFISINRKLSSLFRFRHIQFLYCFPTTGDRRKQSTKHLLGHYQREINKNQNNINQTKQPPHTNQPSNPMQSQKENLPMHSFFI